MRKIFRKRKKHQVSNCKMPLALKCRHRKLTDKKICAINKYECEYYCTVKRI